MQEIKFLFHPYKFEDKKHYLEKSDSNGSKRRFLKGIASGEKTDGHGERLTQKAIKSMQDQANSGDILLYADVHGIKGTDDIGRIESSEISPNGDWIIEARLYDEVDGIGSNTMERVDKLWKQINGLPPYRFAKAKGFSIEGFIPDDGIVEMAQDGRRVIDNVILDGVVTVPRPAYQTSIANAIYKALNETPPWMIEKAADSFKSIIATDEIQNNYYKKRFQFQDLLEERIENIMLSDNIKEKDRALTALFDGYKEAMIELITQSNGIFKKSEYENEEFNYLEPVKKSMNNKIEVLKNLASNIDLVLKNLN
jgi:hypothetical protein